MSLPINMKFEVPKHKAPAPTRTPLWPALVPAPTGKLATTGRPATPQADGRSTAGGSVIRPGTAGTPAAAAPGGGHRAPGGRGEAGRAGRPISPLEGLASAGPADGRPRRNRAHGRSTLVKLAIPVVPMALLAATLGLGCANEKPAAKPTGVMQVGSPQATGAAPTPAAAPAAAAAVKPSAPAPASVPAYQPPAAKTETTKGETTKAAPGRAAAADPAAAGEGQTYVVQKGDTLTKIARLQYGDGNKWKRIADANPGVTPSSIKVGQKLVIPVL